MKGKLNDLNTLFTNFRKIRCATWCAIVPLDNFLSIDKILVLKFGMNY